MITALYFSANWCSPCKVFKPIVKELSIPVEIIDVDTNPKQATEHQIQSLPTLLIFKDNVKAGQFVGVHSLQKLEESIAKIKEGKWDIG